MAAFGPLLETRLAGATPGGPARSGLIERPAGVRRRARRPCSRCCSPPTPRSGTAHARGYYTAAVEIAFAVAAIDLHTSEAELDRHRGLPRHAARRHRRRWRRPGGPSPSAAPAGAGAAPHARDGRGRRARPARSTSCSRSSTPSSASTGVKHEVKLVTNLLRVQKIREERGLPVLRPEPPPDLHRQPRDREDHRRPPARPDLPHPRRGRAGATSWRPTGRASSPATSARPPRS